MTPRTLKALDEALSKLEGESEAKGFLAALEVLESPRWATAAHSLLTKPLTPHEAEVLKDRDQRDCLEMRALFSMWNGKVPDEGDVHTGHCCVDHGCKYGDSDCPVVTGQKLQHHLCEYCVDWYDDY